MKNITVTNNTQSLVNISVGKNVLISNFVNAYDCYIGTNTKIGAFVEIQKDVYIGKNCKISSHTFICSGVTIEDKVFIGHNVTFINDKFPNATNIDGSLQKEQDWTVVYTVVKKGASIGSSVTILCGITIGENAFVGAGSIVTKDVPPNTVSFGNPARVVRQFVDK